MNAPATFSGVRDGGAHLRIQGKAGRTLRGSPPQPENAASRMCVARHDGRRQSPSERPMISFWISVVPP